MPVHDQGRVDGPRHALGDLRRQLVHGGAVAFHHAGLEEGFRLTGRADVVLANIISDVLCIYADNLVDSVSPGGRGPAPLRGEEMCAFQSKGLQKGSPRVTGAEGTASGAAVAARHRARLVERVGELAGDKSLAEADLAREVALLADRLDISEEITRLDSHLGQLGTVLSRGGSVGRQLDFLAQEFFREANTVGSKCNDADVAHLVVDLKTHVERMREQVQNIE